MNKTLVEPTEYIKSIFTEKNKGSENDIVLSILKHLKNLNLPEKRDSKNTLFRQRTAEQILKDGFTTGCNE